MFGVYKPTSSFTAELWRRKCLQCQQVNNIFAGDVLHLIKAQIQKHSLEFWTDKINVELEKNKVLAAYKITLCFVVSNYTMRVIFSKGPFSNTRLLKISSALYLKSVCWVEK